MISMPASKCNSIMTRNEFIGRFFLLTENVLPHDALEQGWVIYETQSFQRVILDFLFEDVWQNYLDSGHAAYQQLSDAQLEHAVSLAEYMLAGGTARVDEMNQQSLEWRGKL
jgi:hypothetical protein